MALIDKVCWSLLASLTIASALSCGKPPAPSAPFRAATAADLSPPKGGDPVGALPSQVVSGEVAAFKATSTDPGLTKDRDTEGSLPSHAAEGRSAVYLPLTRTPD